MNRIDTLFAGGRRGVLSVYCTAGYPQRDSTLEVMEALQDSGVDMIELGMPYSDPLADGPVIQASSMAAIANGMTVELLFQQLQGFRGRVKVPVLLMGYLNTVLQYGFERFCADAAAAGIDGLILPDLPMHEYETQYAPVLRTHGLHLVFLVTPETAPERIRKIDALSSGFLYAVSSSSTTGKNKEMSETYLQRLEAMGLTNPVLVGFGIRDAATFDAACAHTNGAIIGTAFIKALKGPEAAGNTLSEVTRGFIKTIRP
ncbi:MAG TPA: tryptophan synthase subunit alpha [Dinghuibacter sp.]|jgi:tryptophan synthase alpha chain|uniref:tryptophan synthase subunit alpha n=1 Tax=Dinghuibacter sp. TaxID=2024697 RepID=UPI002C867792|nr:tryptophan synthase subunit alpha [Dinghuibacter sp.]HTJ13760.1 tryptophan synthase subunit alpha [Dinghuibacter sp.]